MNLQTKSSSFRQHIRIYNNLFSFASFNANIINFPGRRPGPYCFKIQGQIYYQINTALYPEEGENSAFGQIFIYDENEALEHLLKQNTTLDIEILTIIETPMRTFNAFAKFYKMMADIVEMERDFYLYKEMKKYQNYICYLL